MTPQDRAEFEGHLSALVAILDRQGAVRGGEWKFDCTLPDGREVKRVVQFGGYEKKRLAPNGGGKA